MFYAMVGRTGEISGPKCSKGGSQSGESLGLDSTFLV